MFSMDRPLSKPFLPVDYLAVDTNPQLLMHREIIFIFLAAKVLLLKKTVKGTCTRYAL